MFASPRQCLDEFDKLLLRGFVTHQDFQPKASVIAIRFPVAQYGVFDDLEWNLFFLRLYGFRDIGLYGGEWRRLLSEASEPEGQETEPEEDGEKPLGSTH